MVICIGQQVGSSRITEEQIKLEAEEYAEENYCDEVRATARNAYLDCARLKEKRITELEQRNTNLQIMLKAEREVRVNEDYLKHVTELEAKIEQLEQMLSEQYPNIKQSLDWANQREKKLLEQIADLKKYCCDVSKFLHDNSNVRADNSVYKKSEIFY